VNRAPGNRPGVRAIWQTPVAGMTLGGALQRKHRARYALDKHAQLPRRQMHAVCHAVGPATLG
jgi:hypothetical protein